MSDRPRRFIDLFSGCGGFSLGLIEAGWKGCFAIEVNESAFNTLKTNLVNRTNYDWPSWLPVSPTDIKALTRTRTKELRSLRGKVELVVGGPPCQGFSTAGKRLEDDPRNDLFNYQMKVVQLTLPKVVLLENVMGISYAINGNKVYSEEIKRNLLSLGYVVEQETIIASDFGVPQFRPRFYTVAIRSDCLNGGFFDLLRKNRMGFLKRLGLHAPVSAKQAISDLETSHGRLIDCSDSESPRGFTELEYSHPRSTYQKLMRTGCEEKQPNSMRLVNHRDSTIKRFRKIQSTCRAGHSLTLKERAKLGLKKHSLTYLDSRKPSKTLTTLPDDLIHYSEPRVHSVREHARFQSFPDWFDFLGNFTTGGPKRTSECPRYTQVGNAVPPLLSRALGLSLIEYLDLKR
jgi:DNA (cytosine-5)-methyltransferase 1